MLFNSYEFIFLFLPISLLCFFFLKSREYSDLISLLLLISFLFYGYNNIAHLAYLLITVILNYICGYFLRKTTWRLVVKKAICAGGIFLNLIGLAFYKYLFFSIEILSNFGFDISFKTQHLVLPLAISFYTFQQISYIVDSLNNDVRPHSFKGYFLYVTFFPQLIAGPIVHSSEFFGQLRGNLLANVSADRFCLGLNFFSVGLFKKVILADAMILPSENVFSAASENYEIGLLDSWLGAIAYSFRIYFDFSGYSDMAIGLALLFGFFLPINFKSPYRSKSIIEFWRTWHITLSRFFKKYLYFPLGGGQKGKGRKMMNLLLVMTICGLWHGAGVNFVLWGLYHGFLLIANHLLPTFNLVLSAILSRLIDRVKMSVTYLLVTLGWVLFAGHDMSGIGTQLFGMLGAHGLGDGQIFASGFDFYYLKLSVLLPVTFGKFASLVFGVTILLLVGFVIWYLPNTAVHLGYEKLLSEYRYGDGSIGTLSFGVANLAASVVMFAISIIFLVRDEDAFIYFQF